MKNNLFKKAAMFTDIHYGAKNNSDIHNRDCEEFVHWFIKTAKENDCETCIFLGDYHNNRSAMNLKTMEYAVRGLETLGKNFQKTYFIPGNHDLFFKDKRSVHSTPWAKHIPGVEIIETPISKGNVTLCPWLVNDEWKTVKKLKGEYIFGHFELPHFSMNAMVEMPDQGEIQLDHFKDFSLGFSGHFHKRQRRGNMIYIGNAFPHNFSDAWDDERGMAILEWGSEPYYIKWDEQPTFRTLKLSQLITEPDSYLREKQYVKVTLDIDITFEEASFIKEKFTTSHNVREMILLPEKKEIVELSGVEIAKFETVDQIVSTQLINIQSETYDRNILLELYKTL